MRDLMSALNVTPDGKAPKNPFDLSSFHTLSSKGGQFDVVGVVDTMPNSDYRMSADGFTRTIINNTANFARIKENYYFVHVPLGLINRNAYQLQVQRKEQYSAIDFGITKMPFFDLKTVLKRIAEVCAMDNFTAQANGFLDVHGFNIGFGALRLLDMLGYGSYQDLIESMSVTGGLTLSQVKSIIDTFPPYKPTANRLAAYQCVWYHFFRNDIYDCNVSARSFNFDDVTMVSGTTEPTSNYNILAVRTVDQFIKECLQLRYVPYKKDIFMASMPGTQYGPVSTVDLTANLPLTISGSATLTGTTGTDHDLHHLYRFAGSGGLEVVPNSDIDDTAPYDQTGNPIFPGAKVSDIKTFNEHGYAPGALGFASDSHSFVSSLDRDGHGMLDLHSHSINGSASLSTSGSVSRGQSLFDVLSLVEAQAIQKWRQKSMLAGNKTADQFRAHHGVVPRHLIDHLPDFIGSVDNTIQVTEITSQADTATQADESNLGEIRGRGYGASDTRSFTFKSDDYGILLLIHAIVPENTYDSFGIEKGNTMVTYTDFFQTEYQNIGLEAVPRYLLGFAQNDTPVDPTAPAEGGHDFPARNTGVLGYAPRYFGYKQYQSKVHGMFNTSRLSISPTDRFGYADMQSFVMPRRDFLTLLGVTQSGTYYITPFSMNLSKLYVNPSIFDSIFAIAANNSETTDEFFSHVNFFCHASLPMSVLGLPQF